MPRTNRLALDTCTKLAAAQYGLASREQALRAGLSRDAIKRLLTDGIWKRIHQGTYALWTPEDPQQRWRQRLMAGALWLGKGSAVSHRAAGLVWEVDGLKDSPLELSTRGRRRPEGNNGLIVHHTRTLRPSDIVRRYGLPITSALRTLTDLASVVDTDVMELALESLLRRGLTTLDELGSALDESPRSRPGRAGLGALLDQHPGIPTESPMETKTWQVIRRSDLPLPVRQYVIYNSAGRPIARPDFAYPELRLAIEVDGFASRSNRRDFERVTTKQNALLPLGWTTYHVTAKKLRRPEVMVAEIQALIAIRTRTETPGRTIAGEGR